MDAKTPGLLEYLAPLTTTETALGALAEPVRRWFLANVGAPTGAQRLAWPALAAGKNLLLCAPTGSGKTLAAFLPILGQLLGMPARGVLRCLYVAPLKALGNDVRKNLRAHLHAIRQFLAPDCPAVRVSLRTGDTSARARQRLWSRPPDILLTTPESLAVLLSRPEAAALFSDLRWVVVDEVHALAPTKRGAELSLSLERLADVAGSGLQRIGLSATCAPLREAARFLAGSERPCALAHVAQTTSLALTVEHLQDRGGFVAQLVDRLERELSGNGTTLVFTNTRGLAERLAWALRRRLPALAEQIAVHHSALAAGRRRLVERRLKQGRLTAVVSSTSLELGIDIGAVDGVVLVHPPGGAVRLLQRAGRSGHAPGRPRRALLLTANPAELLEAAVTGASSRSAQYEPLQLPAYPLDVLCQQLVGMAAQRWWSASAAFDLIRRAYPYRDLPAAEFENCLAYLCGRDRNDNPWLPARLRREGDGFTIADDRTSRVLRRNIGTIITEQPRPVRLCEPQDAGEEALAASLLVGEVDEGFADRLQAGDRFLLDGRCLEFRRTAGRELLVTEVVGRPVVPRWGGEGWPVAPELARRLYLLRVQAAEALRDGPPALARLLSDDYGLDNPAAAVLVHYFHRQECVSEIPDAASCLIEIVVTEAGASYYVHTPLNRAGNEALARVVVLRLARDWGVAASSIIADLGFALFMHDSAELVEATWRSVLCATGVDADLDQAIATSATLRERFRQAAHVGLMLLRNPLGGRRRVGGHDWAERRLFQQISATQPDFVLLAQAGREVRTECCDAGAANAFLESFPRLALHWRRLADVSPFAESWTQAAAGPREVLDGPAEALQRLHATLTLGAADEPSPW
ncbi:MAG TPA: DEAD/DEAH box helicase [Gemmataceae bacterium]|nr:DEAD/DEAH box helicase [Gemmataceae bacterium]